MNILSKSKFLATVAHGAIGQKRKYTGEDYIVHPIGVKQILTDYGFSKDINLLCGALLHDVIEDTDITFEFIEEEINIDVANIVYDVTNPSNNFPELNRKARKEMDLLHLHNASNRAMALKLADVIHNAPSLIKYDTNFSKVWIKEAYKVIGVCKDGSEKLYTEAKYILDMGTILNSQK